MSHVRYMDFREALSDTYGNAYLIHTFTIFKSLLCLSGKSSTLSSLMHMRTVDGKIVPRTTLFLAGLIFLEKNRFLKIGVAISRQTSTVRLITEIFVRFKINSFEIQFWIIKNRDSQIQGFSYITGKVLIKRAPRNIR